MVKNDISPEASTFVEIQQASHGPWVKRTTYPAGMSLKALHSEVRK